MKLRKKSILVLIFIFVSIDFAFSSDISSLFKGIDSDENATKNIQSSQTEKQVQKSADTDTKLPTISESKQPIEKKIKIQPAGINAPDLIDVPSIPGKFKDNIVVINKVDDSMVSLKINAISNGNLIPVGQVVLHWFNDESKINSSKILRLADFNTFQIEPSDGKKYAYKTEKRNNDLIIEVREWGSDLSKAATPKWTANSEAFLFDMKSLEDEPDENVKILCNSSRGVSNTFSLYAYETKYKRWVRYGSLQIKNLGKAEKLKKEKNIEDIDDYRYFAIETKNANSYKYRLEEKSDDLFITVND